MDFIRMQQKCVPGHAIRPSPPVVANDCTPLRVIPIA